MGTDDTGSKERCKSVRRREKREGGGGRWQTTRQRH